ASGFKSTFQSLMPVAWARRSRMQRVASPSLMVPLLSGAAAVSFELSALLAFANAGVLRIPNAATIKICRMTHLRVDPIHPLASAILGVAIKYRSRKRGAVARAPTLAPMSARIRHDARRRIVATTERFRL